MQVLTSNVDNLDSKRPVPPDDITLIAGFPLFRGIDLREISEPLGISEFIDLRQGDILVKPTEPNTRLFILIRGKLSVHTEMDRNPVAILRPGDCIGEMSLFEGELPSAFVLSVDTAKVLAIHKEIIWRLVDSSSTFAQNLLHLLLQRIRSGNQSLSEIQEKLQVQEISAFIDPLTGIYNRRWLNTMFKRALERRNRSADGGSNIFLLMIDIDHFKQYNDTYGHLAGDQCLRMVASTLRDNMRPTDLLARYGGEEFSILLTGSDGDNSVSMAERLRVAVSCREIKDRRGATLPSVTISIGVAEYRKDEALEDLIESADRCLYQAKQQGRNRVFMN